MTDPPPPPPESFKLLMHRYPLSVSDNTPGYSNMAFQILSYAAEKITGTPFPELIKRHLIKPLNLKRTFVTSPGDAFPDSVIIPQAWELDMGDLAPYVPPALPNYEQVLTPPQQRRLLHLHPRPLPPRPLHPPLLPPRPAQHPRLAQGHLAHRLPDGVHGQAVGNHAAQRPGLPRVERHPRDRPLHQARGRHVVHVHDHPVAGGGLRGGVLHHVGGVAGGGLVCAEGLV